MRQYLQQLEDVLTYGRQYGDRTGTGTISTFGSQARYNLSEGFPLVTTKQVSLKNIFNELMWMIRGQTNSQILEEQNTNIWKQWGYTGKKTNIKPGELGPVYGSQWRQWKGLRNDDTVVVLDQLKALLEGLKSSPHSRRHYLTAWNPILTPIESQDHNRNIEEGRQVLPPCHLSFQLYVTRLTPLERVRAYNATVKNEDEIRLTESEEDVTEQLLRRLDELEVPSYGLSGQMYQRSADMCLGVPYNIAFYSLFLKLIALEVNMLPWEFIHVIGDAHVYLNHINNAKEQITRQPFLLPKLVVNKQSSIEEYQYSDLALIDYEHHPVIRYPVAI